MSVFIDNLCVRRYKRVRGWRGRPVCERSLREHWRLIPLHLQARIRHDPTEPLHTCVADWTRLDRFLTDQDYDGTLDWTRLNWTS